MFPATRDAVPLRGPVRRAVWQVALLLTAFAWPGVGARAQEAAADEGLFITIANPITSEVVNRVKARTNRAVQRTDRRIRKIIFDFTPGRQPTGGPSGTKDYGPCHDLAEFFLELQDLTTVAFVHNDVTGHTVLPVLACREIVLSAEAKLGDVL